ncbi:MAG: SusC/RagA family TonB-linked outer membrane protein [Saprospiraceae bacterium]|nr:MAG: SusC/RagA family TonB-linked outer membrane protein [Saprospiraceae bacterium]
MKEALTKFQLLVLALLLFSSAALAQFTVSGTVTDESGTPLIGATVLAKGTSVGTVTDVDGSFSLRVPEGTAALVISYTGYATTEVPVSASSTALVIQLKEDIARLEEVVVTGLASGVKRSNSGNAVTTITADELTGNTRQQTMDGALYGKIPGVNISANSGAPGGGINIQMRGVSTLGAGSSQPLFIIDGVYVDNSVIRNGRTNVNGASAGQNASSQDDASNRIADINPEDIERIEVLKGPSAAAIYGTRANAGVVIITTKKGAAGQNRVTLTQDIGFAKAQNLIGFDTWDEQKIQNFFGGDPDELAALQAAQQEGRVTDWEKYFYGETPLLSNTQLTFSGGTDKLQYYASGGFQTEDGIIKYTGFDRYSTRLNLNATISPRVRLSFNNSYYRTDTRRGFTGNQNNTGGSIGYTLAYTPSYANLFPDENGNYPDNPYFNDNPIAIRDLGKNDQKVDRFISAANLDVDLWTGDAAFLKLKVNGGADFLSSNTFVYFPEILQHQRASANPGDVMWGRQDNLNTNLQAFLQFNADAGELNLNTTLGGVRLDQESEFLLERGRGLAGGQTNLRWAKVASVHDQRKTKVTDLGWVAQEDINWQDKIIASVGVRFDRSTLNADQEKYYAFPKASLAVNLSNFDFWNVSSINQLKLRAAYGETGGLPNYGVTYESLSPQLIGNFLGGQVGTRGIDPNLKPETAAELEFGLDLGMLDNRLFLEATYFNKKVKDLILDLTPAESTGITAIATNAADLENKGVELSLGISPVRTTNFNWFSRINWWKVESKITRLDIPTQTVGGFGVSLGTYLIAEGYSPTTIVGLPGGTDKPGGWTIYGDRQPDWQMSWYNSINFLQNFDFSFLFHYQKGGHAINLSALLWDDGGTTPGWDEDKDGNGQFDGLDRLLDWAVNRNTGAYIEETSYIKLREVALHYRVPSSVLGKGFIKGLRVGVSANNILLWTTYGSYDPEVSNFGTQPIAANIEVTPYPSSRRMFFHLKADF